MDVLTARLAELTRMSPPDNKNHYSIDAESSGVISKIIDHGFSQRPRRVEGDSTETCAPVSRWTIEECYRRPTAQEAGPAMTDPPGSHFSHSERVQQDADGDFAEIDRGQPPRPVFSFRHLAGADAGDGAARDSQHA